MQGLVTAHNISSISVKTKLAYKRNYIMGLCPIILYLLQFVTGIYGTYPFNFIFCISRVSLSFQLGRHSGADLFQPFLPLAHLAARPIGSGYSSKFWMSWGMAVTQHLWFICHCLSTIVVDKKNKFLISNNNFLCPVFPTAFVLLLHTSVSVFSTSFQWVVVNRSKISSQPSPSGRMNPVFSDSPQMWLCGHLLCPP